MCDRLEKVLVALLYNIIVLNSSDMILVLVESKFSKYKDDASFDTFFDVI